MEFPNLANLFRPTTATAAPAATGTGVPPQGGAPRVDPNNPATGLENNNKSADPANQNLDGARLGDPTGKPEGSPMDAFKDIFKIDPTKQAPKDPLKEPLLSLDPAKIAEAVNKMDFTKGIDPALMQKALQGDVASLGQVVNQAARNSYMGSFQAITGILERAISVNNERFGNSLDGRFRNFQVNSAQSKNPVLNHDSVKPVLASLRSLIAQQNPTMHPEAVATQAEEYFLTMGKSLASLNTEDVDADGKKKTGDAVAPDFSTWA